MGTKTPNMSIYKPSNGEDLYNSNFQLGLDNIDTHDHSGAPNNGVQIGTSGIQDGAITPEKLSEQILQEATVQTTDAVPTEVVSIPVPNSSSVTVGGRFNALKSDATMAIGGSFLGVFHRPTASSVGLVGSVSLTIDDNTGGTPDFQLVADTGNEAVSLRCVGIAASTYNWNVVYNALAWP